MEIRSSAKLFLGGTLGALAGALGLVRLGTAPFLVLRDALLLRGGDPLPESLQHGGTLALFGLLFGLATVVALLGLLQLTRTAHLNSLALILLIASGAASAVGGAGLWMGASRELASFRVVASSAASPQPEQISAAAAYGLSSARVGFAGLLAGAVLLLVLSCNSLGDSPRRALPSEVGRVAGGLSAASVMGFSLLLAVTWFPLHALRIGVTSGTAVRAAEVAMSLSRTLELSMLAAGLLLVYGVLVILLGILQLRAACAKSRSL